MNEFEICEKVREFCKENAYEFFVVIGDCSSHSVRKNGIIRKIVNFAKTTPLFKK